MNIKKAKLYKTSYYFYTILRLYSEISILLSSWSVYKIENINKIEIIYLLFASEGTQ